MICMSRHAILSMTAVLVTAAACNDGKGGDEDAFTLVELTETDFSPQGAPAADLLLGIDRNRGPRYTRGREVASSPSDSTSTCSMAAFQPMFGKTEDRAE
jgi:hypothetical protein